MVARPLNSSDWLGFPLKPDSPFEIILPVLSKSCLFPVHCFIDGLFFADSRPKLRQRKQRLNRKWYQLGLVCLLSVGMGLLLYTHSLSEEKTTLDLRPHTLADTSGKIEEVVINLPSDLSQETLPVLEQLLRLLPSDVSVKVCCTDDTYLDGFMNDCRWLFDPKRRHSDIVLSGLKLTPWARDRRIPRTDAYGRARSSLIPPPKPWHGADRRDETRLPFIMHQLDLAPDYETLPFFLDGGNMVSDEDRVFIGGNHLEMHGLRKSNASELKEMLGHFLGRPVFFVHGSGGKVPWSHLDMFFTVLPGKRAMVASHALAKSLMDASKLNQASSMELVQSIMLNPKTEVMLDEIAQQLGRLGYRVTRVAGIPNPEQQWFLTYNNVLMDFRENRSIVILPHYGIPCLDEHARDLYTSLGFEVAPINVRSIYQDGGAIRCFANVTRRKPGWLEKSDPLVTQGYLRVHRVGIWEHLEISSQD